MLYIIICGSSSQLLPLEKLIKTHGAKLLGVDQMPYIPSTKLTHVLFVILNNFIMTVSSDFSI